MLLVINYSKDIIEGSTVFSLEANAFEIIFKSTVSKKIDLKFFNSVLPRSFFFFFQLI